MFFGDLQDRRRGIVLKGEMGEGCKEEVAPLEGLKVGFAANRILGHKFRTAAGPF